jgi:uncharacterized protein
MRSLFSILLVTMTVDALSAADRVLVVTATKGYRHESIETAEMVLTQISRRTPSFEIAFAREEKDMARMMTADALRGFKVVMFVNSTGELALPDRNALLQWVRTGGSLVGVHSASDTWHEWPEWIEMLGGEFLEHPPEFLADIVVEDQTHPATAGLNSLMFVEEIYSFKNFHRDRVRVLLSLRGAHPLAWWQRYGSGRVLYTALGHRIDVWELDWFQKHLAGAIQWGLGKDVPKKLRPVRR